MDEAQQFTGLVNSACLAQHEWFESLRRSGFTRVEALWIVTRSSVEICRLEWLAGHPDHAQPQ